MPWRRSAVDGAAIFENTRFVAPSSCSRPVGWLVCASRTMWPAGGCGGVLRDSCNFQCERICDGHVAIHAREEHGIRGGDCVEIGARGIAAAGPERLVPSEAGDPFTGSAIIYIRANALLEFGERLYAGEINSQFGERRLPDVHVCVVESWHHERAMQVNDASVRAKPRLESPKRPRFWRFVHRRSRE